MEKERFAIARIGRAVGLKGQLKLHILSDFPDQFRAMEEFESDLGVLRIEQFDKNRSVVKFVGFDDRTSAQRLVNKSLYSSIETTRLKCKLKDSEYFWFDVVGSKVMQEDLVLGIVENLQRIAATDYLHIKTAKELKDKGLPKSFLLPYIPRYIDSFDLEKKALYTIDAFEVLSSS